MVVQPNAALGNAPKNPRYTLSLSRRYSAPNGPKSAEVENSSEKIQFIPHS